MGKWIFLIVTVLFLTGLGYAGYKAYPYYRLYMLRDAPAMDIDGDTKKDFFVPTGATAALVAKKLAQQKLIHTPADFRFFAKAKNYRGRRIVPGRYILNGEMTYNKLVNHLRAGRGRKPVKISFHYLKGLQDLANKVGRQIEATPAQLMAAFQDPKNHKKYELTKGSFPIMFLSDTYKLQWACSPDCFLKRMHRAYRRFWRGKNDRKRHALKLSRFEIAILASLVMAEQSKKPDEWPKIAGLYLNRLRRKIKLQADPTVKFALGQPGLKRILFKHLKVKSPYNTYIHHGLPPGLLRWPEKRAIQAVLNYQHHNYIFMCAKPEYSGYHNFAKTNKQHSRNAKKYHRWLTKQGIR